MNNIVIMKNKTELRQELLDRFWSIYEVEGTLQALSWLDTLKYYEDYCQDEIDMLSHKLSSIL